MAAKVSGGETCMEAKLCREQPCMAAKLSREQPCMAAKATETAQCITMVWQRRCPKSAEVIAICGVSSMDFLSQQLSSLDP